LNNNENAKELKIKLLICQSKMCGWIRCIVILNFVYLWNIRFGLH
jgi:hypothetical protein